MVKKTLIHQEVDSDIWNRVKLFQIHNNIKNREEALEKIILLGWSKYKEIEDENIEIKVVKGVAKDERVR